MRMHNAARPSLGAPEQGGTLPLDEVGDMSLVLQAKLLRVLQEREIVPVGGTHALKVDVRVIAAPLHDLASQVASGAFREDLFYRLNVLHLHVPPLSERLEDIVLLVQHCLAHAAQPPKRLTPATQGAVLAYPWPSNVRELKNGLERASMLTPGLEIDAVDLDLPGAAWRIPVEAFLAGTLSKAVARLEEVMIRKERRRATKLPPRGSLASIGSCSTVRSNNTVSTSRMGERVWNASLPQPWLGLRRVFMY